ncbi:MAG: adenine nucleotide alpha hydrolase [Deltaproteobacteria bacterium]|nr:MAG: adenine nucleotide alpha hydrolase [Deltaproteobacteria bacterium]
MNTSTSGRPKAVVAWSSGKDAAFALHRVRTEGVLDVVGLLTTVTAPYDRVSMHGVRREILRAQARATGLDVHEVEIPAPCPNAVYEEKMGAAVAQLRARGVTRIVFGDLFLEDVRAYRERQLDGTGLEPVFPLWGEDTRRLAREMIDAGIVAYVVTLDPGKVPRTLAGARFDAAFLDALPADVDPCGERGEFHTCVVDGPMFRAKVPVRPGAVVERDGFVFADLEPVEAGPP